MSSAKVISLISPKGGSGKTITATSLASVLAYFDLPTMLLDGDAATNGLSLLFVEKIIEFKNARKSEKLLGIFDLAKEKSRNVDIAVTEIDLGKEGVLVPATFTMEQTDDVELHHYKLVLADTIAKSRAKFAAIFVDAQAGSDQFAREAAAVNMIRCRGMGWLVSECSSKTNLKVKSFGNFIIK